MEVAELEINLARNAERLRRYVAGKVPVSLKTEIIPNDVLQEVWVAAFRTAEGFEARNRGSLYVWLTTIADTKVVDAVRRAQAYKRGGDRRHVAHVQADATSFVGLWEEIASSEQTPSRAMSAEEVAHTVQIALGRLPERDRQALWLRYIEGRPVAEVAQAMGKSKAAAHSLLYTARIKLRAVLGNPGRFFTDVPDSGGQGA